MKTKFRVLALMVLPLLLVLITGADHRDAPGLLTEPAADINDVYVFVNPNTSNVVLAMTVNPFTAPGLNPMFSPECLYQFKIDNTGDAVEDLVIQVTFDAPNLTPNALNATPTSFNPAQNFECHSPNQARENGRDQHESKIENSAHHGTGQQHGHDGFHDGCKYGHQGFCGLARRPVLF